VVEFKKKLDKLVGVYTVYDKVLFKLRKEDLRK